VLAPEFGGRFEAEIADVDGDGGEAVVTLRPERGEARRIPLAAIKEARLAFRL
jgi:ribosome maturation factor RimP